MRIYNDSIALKRSIFSRIMTATVLLLFCCSCSMGEDGNGKRVETLFDARGHQMRVDIETTFHELSKVDVRMIYDLNGVCSKYIPKHTSFADVEKILRAAGASSNLKPAFNHLLPAESKDSGEVASGFVLSESSISNTSFRVVIRPESTNLADRRVGEVTICEVIQTSI
jgi:major membrane immunogen (membrane-anchored lipoprotein)